MKVIEVPCTKIQFSVSFAGAFRFVYIEKERKLFKKKKNQQIKRKFSDIEGDKKRRVQIIQI